MLARIASVVVVLATAVHAQELPHGAKARLGTQRPRLDEKVLALATDGKLLAAGGVDRTVRLIDAATNREVRKLVGHEGAVTAVAFAPSCVVSGSLDGTVRRWDPTTGALLGKIDGLGRVRAVAVAGKTIAVGSDERPVSLVEDDKVVRTLAMPEKGAQGLAFSPDGTRLATGSTLSIVANADDRTVRVYVVATGELESSRRVGSARAVAFSPEGKLAVATDEGVRMDDKLIEGKAAALAFSKELVAVASDKVVRVHEVATGKLVAKLQGHEDVVSAVAFFGDSELATSSEDRTVRTWDARKGGELHAAGHSKEVVALAFSGKRLASAGEDKAVLLWNAETLAVEKRFDLDETPASLAFSPDGSSLAVAVGNAALVFDLVGTAAPKKLTGHEGAVRSVAWSPDGRSLATGSEDGTVRVTELIAGKEPLLFDAHAGRVTCVVFSPEGKRLAASTAESGRRDETIRIWALGDSKETTVSFYGGPVQFAIAYSPDGKVIASEAGPVVFLWDVRAGKKVGKLDGNTKDVGALAWSPDGKRIVTGGFDRAVRIYEATGKLVRTLEGHTGGVNAVAYSSDGKVVASGSDDGTVILWDAVP